MSAYDITWIPAAETVNFTNRVEILSDKRHELLPVTQSKGDEKNGTPKSS